MRLTMFALAGVSLCFTGQAFAQCEIEAGSVRILSNDFPALRAVETAAAECASDSVTVTANATSEHRTLQVPALTANPAEYSVAIVANGSIVPLLNEGLVRPLNDLVAKYGQDLDPQQLITIDGNIMAVAFMANAQHLYYRADILEAAGVEPPTSYEEVLVAAKAIKDAGLSEIQWAGTFGAGYDLGQEFINMYLGMGGSLFDGGSATASVNNENGVATLEQLKALTPYMIPEYLSTDANMVQADWEAGKTAMMVLWGSRAAAILDDQGAAEGVVDSTMLAAAPSAGTAPATTLFWDGFTIATNVSDQDAEASFQAMMHALSTDMANANAEAATWLIPGAEATNASTGTRASADAGAVAYPMLPQMSLLHTALGAELAPFFQGSKSAADALADAEAAYTTAARQGGYLQ